MCAKKLVRQKKKERKKRKKERQKKKEKRKKERRKKKDERRKKKEIKRTPTSLVYSLQQAHPLGVGVARCQFSFVNYSSYVANPLL